MKKRCGNCAHSGKPCYDWPCTVCRLADDRPPTHWEAGSALKPMTNADRIRVMSDEELAWELMTWRIETETKHHGIESNYPSTQRSILAWLQQPAEVN